LNNQRNFAKISVQFTLKKTANPDCSHNLERLFICKFPLLPKNMPNLQHPSAKNGQTVKIMNYRKLKTVSTNILKQ